MRPSQATQVLAAAVNSGTPIMLWGAPGIGKSAIVKQFAQSASRDVRDVRISQLDSVDLRGVPSVSEGITRFNPPEFLPHDQQSRGVLFLDEINSGSTATMAAAYQLVLDRALGTYRLPRDWAIVAAGNRAQDRSLVNQMPLALRNRFIHIELEVNNEDWNNWAIVAGVHDAVRGFMRYRPTLLNELDASGKDDATRNQIAQKLKDARAFATPRSWEFLSNLLHIGVPSSVEYDTYGSAVGEGAAAEFIAYMKYQTKMPNLDHILLSPDSAPVPEEPATLYATTTGLASKTTPDNLERVIKYLNRLPVEFAVMTIKDSVTRDNSIADTKAFNDWAAANTSVLL